MRRVWPPDIFASWLDRFLPDLPRVGDRTAENWLAPEVVTDPTDGKLAHLDGLNLSRAWMLDGIAAGLPLGDLRVDLLRASAKRHAESGLASVTGEHYEGGHWLASFAAYLVTERGIGSRGMGGARISGCPVTSVPDLVRLLHDAARRPLILLT